LTGRPLFTGVFNAKAAKSKNENKPPAKGNGTRYKVKFTVAVKKGSSHVLEWCLASFNSAEDRDNFTKAYTNAIAASPKKEETKVDAAAEATKKIEEDRKIA
jgi:hypothetical protein